VTCFVVRLSWLPVWEDDDESPHVYGYLCDLIETHHPLILGPNHANLPKLVAIIAEAFARDAISVEHKVAQRMISLLRQIQVLYKLTHYSLFFNYTQFRCSCIFYMLTVIISAQRESFQFASKDIGMSYSAIIEIYLKIV